MWTDEQLSAIKSPVTNLLVSASAGSGKTAVMTERIIERIMSESGCDIDKILVMTYTNAAAAEIKERINARIMQKLDENPSDIHLKKQLALSSNSHFSTIHSFCLDIIKSNFNSLGLDPAFRTGDPAEIELIKRDAIDQTFEKFYQSGDKRFLKFVSSYTKRDDSKLLDVILKIYDFSRTFPEPEKWLDGVVKEYKDGYIGSYSSVILKKASFYIRKAISIYKKAIKLCDLDKEGRNFSEFLQQEMELARDGLKSLSGWDRAYEFFSDIKFKTRSATLIKKMEPEIAKVCVKKRDEAKALFSDIKKLIDQPKKDFKSRMKAASCYVEVIRDLVNEFSHIFASIKAKKAIIDYSDYEHLSLKCLMDEEGNRTEYAKELAASFEEIYIDEYQDCNNVQEQIFSLISGVSDGKNNIFMVGDAKQSIYKFRDADPSLFTVKQKIYEKYNPDSVSPYSLITLNKNFRSRKEILNGVNHIFSYIMTEDVGEIEYSEDEYLYYNENADYDDNEEFSSVDIGVVNFEPENYPDEDFSYTVESAEAIYIAKKIRHLIDSKTQVYDKKNGFRDIRYSDIAVLVRSLTGNIQVYSDVFKMYSIPLFADYNQGYLTTEEISSLISLIKITLNPLDDIEFVSVLRMSIFGFNEDELLKIRIQDKGEFFYEAMKLYEKNNKDALGLKIKKFLELFNDLRNKSKLLSTTEFISYLMEKTNYREYVLSLPMPKQAIANINLFIKRAEEFGKSDFKGIFNFIHFINENLREKNDSKSAAVLSETDDVVRLMTIHKSKGLEFPVVILSRCAREFYKFDSSGDFLLHKELGLGLKFADIDTHFSYPLLTHTAIKELIDSERLSEEERVLYVALTRAREKLIIVGCMKNAYAAFERYDTQTTLEKPFTMDILLDADCFLDWIIPSVMSIDPNKATYVGEYETKGTKFKIDICDSHTLDISDAFVKSADNDVYSLFNEEKECNEKSSDNEIYKRFTYKYPDTDLDVPTAFTVTELKEFYNKTDSDEEASYYSLPPLKTLDAKKDSSALRKGTVTHLVLKLIDFSAVSDISHIDDLLNKMAEQNIIEKEDIALVDKNNILDFVKSDLGKKIAQSKAVYREFPFKILKDAKDVHESFSSSEETIVIQGTADLFFENERGNYTLIDYKTDKTDNVDEIINNYKNQIILYKAAIEEITSKKCDECCIYLLNSGKIIKI